MKVLIFLLLVAPSIASNYSISEGFSAEEGQFPYIAHLEFQWADEACFCGGALISLEWIVTAAQCAERAKRVYVTLGTIYSKGTDGIKIESKKITKHEKYNNATHENDIALIQIDLRNSEYNASLVEPLSLPDLSEMTSSYEGKIAVVSGWGKEDLNQERSKALKYVYLDVISNEKCQEHYDDELEIKESMMCLNKGPKGICNGDFGCPLELVNSDILIGVAIHHDDACKNGYCVFSRVTSYLDWITDITGL